MPSCHRLVILLYKDNYISCPLFKHLLIGNKVELGDILDVLQTRGMGYTQYLPIAW
jgi:hypothetical protein